MKAATSDTVNRRHTVAISIHAAREGGDHFWQKRIAYRFISIHAAREGGDLCAGYGITRKFISIHAAREGGDSAVQSVSPVTFYFNPRRP